ncbi:MAG: hypothetical protein NC489_25970 [Ruminococcus flavefaciens]|nr:hypothetical protein [Ruminococcus flavefaciens]
MYDRTKYLTGTEAYDLGMAAAKYIGISRQDLQLLSPVLLHMIQSHIEKEKAKGGGRDS